MLNRLSVVTFVLAAVLSFGMAAADVVVRVEVVGEKPVAGEPVTQETLMTLETLPDASGAFLARTTLGKQVIEIKGTVKPTNQDRRRVSLKFSDRGELSLQQISANAELIADQPKTVGGLKGPKEEEREIILTLVTAPGN